MAVLAKVFRVGVMQIAMCQLLHQGTKGRFQTEIYLVFLLLPRYSEMILNMFHGSLYLFHPWRDC